MSRLREIFASATIALALSLGHPFEVCPGLLEPLVVAALRGVNAILEDGLQPLGLGLERAQGVHRPLLVRDPVLAVVELLGISQVLFANHLPNFPIALGGGT